MDCSTHQQRVQQDVAKPPDSSLAPATTTMQWRWHTRSNGGAVSGTCKHSPRSVTFIMTCVCRLV